MRGPPTPHTLVPLTPGRQGASRCAAFAAPWPVLGWTGLARKDRRGMLLQRPFSGQPVACAARERVHCCVQVCAPPVLPLALEWAPECRDERRCELVSGL